MASMNFHFLEMKDEYLQVFSLFLKALSCTIQEMWFGRFSFTFFPIHSSKVWFLGRRILCICNLNGIEYMHSFTIVVELTSIKPKIVETKGSFQSTFRGRIGLIGMFKKIDSLIIFNICTLVLEIILEGKGNSKLYDLTFVEVQKKLVIWGCCCFGKRSEVRRRN